MRHFASTLTTSHSVLPVWVFEVLGHLLQFVLAQKPHRRTWVGLKMDVLQSWINFGGWGGQGVCRCTDSAAFNLESLEANHLYKQTHWKRSNQTVLLPNYTLNVRWLNKLWGTEEQSRLFWGKIFNQFSFFSGGQWRHTSVLLSVSCSALTVGSSIMQDVLIITHRHVFRATVLNRSLFAFTQICKYRHGKSVASTNTWNDRHVRIPHWKGAD